jgi:hypothetical protein
MLVFVVYPVPDTARPADTDPAPPGRSHWLVIAFAVAAILILVGVVNQHRGKTTALEAAPVPHPKTHRVNPAVTTIGLAGRPVDLNSAGDLFYVLTEAPARLMRLDAIAPHRTLRSTAIPAGAFRLLVEHETSRLWVLQHNGSTRTFLTEYDPLSLSQLSRRLLPVGVLGASVYNSRLWLGSEEGLYTVDADGHAGPKLVRGVGHWVISVLLDRAGDRIIAGSLNGAGSSLTAIGLETQRIQSRAEISVGNVSFARTENSLWIAGWRPDGSGMVDRLDPHTLQPISTAPSVKRLDRAVEVWPGDRVVWVVEAGTATCMSQLTGAVLSTTAKLSGPVVPGLQAVYAIGSRAVQVLDLTGTQCLVR